MKGGKRLGKRKDTFLLITIFILLLNPTTIFATEVKELNSSNPEKFPREQTSLKQEKEEGEEHTNLEREMNELNKENMKEEISPESSNEEVIHNINQKDKNNQTFEKSSQEDDNRPNDTKSDDKDIVLKNGIRHEKVVELKENLALLGFWVTREISDYFDDNTKRKVIEF